VPFGLRTQVGPGNPVLDGSPDPPWEGPILGEKGRPIVSMGTLGSHLCKNG